ncbi:MAG: T9SS type A sorting domain-containing protein [Bacteroidota bacterium]
MTDTEASGANSDLAIDANGNMHLSFWLEGEDRLAYGFRDKSSGTWTIAPIVDTGNYGYRSSIAVDDNGDVHITYLFNNAGSSQLRYATNASGSWVVESLFSGVRIGPYGADLTFPTYIQPSIDIFIQASGEPAIIFFNGEVPIISTCNGIQYYGAGYELNMNILRQQANGSWAYEPFDPIPYRGNNGCLVGDDRVGEFCQAFPRKNGPPVAIGNSLHNHELLVFQANSDSLNQWETNSVDSLLRTYSNFGFNEGFNFIDGSLSNDSILHLTYRVANHYGLGPLNFSRQHFFYTKVNLNSLGDSAYTPFHHDFFPNNFSRSHFSITHNSDEDVFVTYMDDRTGTLVVTESQDGGNNWTSENLFDVVTNTKVQSDIFGDSLYVLVYDVEKKGLRMSSRSLTGTNWVHEFATISEERANAISSEVVRTPGDDKIYIAFDEGGQEQLFFGERINNSWTYEAIDSAGRGLGAISMVMNASSEPCIAYVFEANETLRLAHRMGLSWQTEIIDTESMARDIVLKQYADSLHMVYYDISEGVLKYARGKSGGQWVISVLDSSSLIVGQRPDLFIDQGGGLHVSYNDVFFAKFKYAYRSVNGIWSVEDMSATEEFTPSFHSIQGSSTGTIHIAFRDAGVDSIYLATKVPGGSWSHVGVAGENVSQIGIPLKLLIDESDRPWILYNYASVKDELRLIRRDKWGNWHDVSVINNQAEIANVFDFQLVGEDFYVIGKQNQVGNKGVGFLFAERGVATSVEQWSIANQWELYPNPSSSSLSVALQTSAPMPVNIGLYNLDGRLIHTLLETSTLSAGTHQFDWVAQGISPGIYLVQLRTANLLLNKKWVFIP